MVLAGAMDANSSRKVTHFASLCNMFHIPMIHLLDCPGFMLGLQSEEAGTLRFGMGATFEVFRSEVPRLTVAIRKAYGMGSGLSFTDHTLRYRMAWPSAEFGSLPIEGGVAAAYRREIAAAADPAKRTAELEAELLKFSSPFRSAEHFSVEDIIDPRETRYRLCMLVEAAQGRIKTLLGRTPTYGVRP
jgi:acetyl-CoA carboxylase carboxyltransferase component